MTTAEFPFTAIVGQDRLREALLVSAVAMRDAGGRSIVNLGPITTKIHR